MLLFLVLSDRPGFAGKTTMLTYIQINAADIEAHRAIANAILAGNAPRAVSAIQDILNEAATLIERARKLGGGGV
jgi:DNA-binding GntR family transcriptional regulator